MNGVDYQDIRPGSTAASGGVHTASKPCSEVQFVYITAIVIAFIL